MIEFTLTCEAGHRFESWFQSAKAYDTLHAAGHVTCAICGSGKVEKALMAPRVQASRQKPGATEPATTHDSAMSDSTSAESTGPDSAGAVTSPAQNPLSRPLSERAKALAELRRRVEQNSDYVGLNFVQQARDMHEGLAPERPIHGEARPEEARKLLEDGVPVTPLPFIPGRKTN